MPFGTTIYGRLEAGDVQLEGVVYGLGLAEDGQDEGEQKEGFYRARHITLSFVLAVLVLVEGVSCINFVACLYNL